LLSSLKKKMDSIWNWCLFMNDYGRKKFKQFAKMNRLRLQRSEDGNPIVVSRGKVYAGSMLYEGFSGDFVGLCVVRNTTAKLTSLANKLDRMGFTPLVRGDYEATYKVPYSRVWEIARMFRMVKKMPSNQNMSGINEWREKQ